MVSPLSFPPATAVYRSVEEVPGIHRRRAVVIHNASFDISFINAELDRIKRQVISRDRLVETLLLARRKIRACPTGSTISLTLCDRNSRRYQAGALLDAELLAEVYIDLSGAQSQLILASETPSRGRSVPRYAEAQRDTPAACNEITDADREAHRPLSPRWATSRLE